MTVVIEDYFLSFPLRAGLQWNLQSGLKIKCIRYSEYFYNFFVIYSVLVFISLSKSFHPQKPVFAYTNIFLACTALC